MVVGEPDRSHRVAALKQHPAWEDLKAEWAEVKEDRTFGLGRKFLTGTPLDQRSIDMERGFWRGVAAVLDTPERAEQAARNMEGTRNE